MRETFINIFVDDIGLIQNKIAFNQNRHLSIGSHHCNIFRFVEQIHIPYFKIHTLLKSHEPATLREWTSRAGIQNHHFLIFPEFPKSSKERTVLLEHARAFFSRLATGASAKTVWGSMRAEQAPSRSDGGDPAASPNDRKQEATQGKSLKNALDLKERFKTKH